MKGLFGWNFPVARKVGKAFGIGLSEKEKHAKDMSFGQISGQDQIDIASGRLNPDTGEYSEPSGPPVNPKQARVASRYGAQAQGAGRSLDQMPGELYEEESSDAQANTWSGKPASEWTNDEVKQMQQNLKTAGYTDWEGKELVDDGMLGKRTISALRKAQGAFGRGDRAVDQTEPIPFSGPAGDQSTVGMGAVDDSGGISTGARMAPTVARPVDETGEISEPYSPAPPAMHEEPSIGASAKRVGKSYWDYLSGNQGWAPDLWQR